MSREWKPGTVLVDNSGRVVYAIEVTANTIAAAKAGQAWEEGACIIEADGNGWHPSHFENLRPLIVIDAEDREAVERLQELFADERDKNGGGSRLIVGGWADAMQAALREFANPRDPKPDEPQGLGAVVECEHKVYDWARATRIGNGFAPWYYTDSSGNGGLRTYDDLAVVRILSPGVTS